MGKKSKLKIHARDAILDFLRRAESFLEGDQLDEHQIRFRLEKLETKWDEFEEIQSEIEGCEEYESHVDANRQARAEFEERYFEVRAGLTRKLPQATITNPPPSTSSAALNVQTYVRLPQINLPEFDGSYEKWLPFYDTFRALIDSSPELSNIQKFHYLRSSLKGDALRLLDSFPISDGNYNVAWDSLVARFSNNYLLKKRHLNAIFEYPKMKKASAMGIHDLVDCFERNTKILDQLGEITGNWSAILIHLMVSKLNDGMQLQWEEHVAKSENPSFRMLIEFLKTQTRVLDAVLVDQQIFNSNSAPASMTRVSVNSVAEGSGPNCMVCNGQHFFARCPQFSEMPLDARLQFTNSKRLCSNCLGRNHLARDCPSRYRCRTCGKKHHTSLHPGFPGSGATTPSAEEHDTNNTTASTSGDVMTTERVITSTAATVSANAAEGHGNSYVFLSTVLLQVQDVWGKTHFARALLDSGSQANLMSEQLSQLLMLPRRNKRSEIIGIGQSKGQTTCEVSATIGSRIRKFNLPMDFLVLGKVISNQPLVTLPRVNWKLPIGMDLADPEFYESGPIDLVLGAQSFYDFHLVNGGRLQTRKINDELPQFINTVFGWVATGEVKDITSTRKVSCNLMLADSLDKAIEKFWTIEELPEKPPRSREEEDCETHFCNTFSRDVTGRYVVRYPKRMGFYSMIGESKGMAMRRYQQTERRLEMDINLRKQYNEFMQEYIDLGHMKLIGVVNGMPNNEKTVCYLPHHAVFKESSSTTKLRVVFDGSAKTSTNYSLNEALLTGPVIQDDLFDLMVRFRKHAVALVADVAKMYRQVRIHPDDTPLQRILWRFSPSEPIMEYELQTVTYGLSPSSFLATRVLKQMAIDNKDEYKESVLAIEEDFYMDDFLSGADSVKKAKRLQVDVQTILAKGGFQLRKWSSNKLEALEGLPAEALDDTTKLHLEQQLKIKTLGVVWETKSDCLCIEVHATNDNIQWTKRKICSAIAKLYDPLGLVSPVVAWAKIRLQHVWLATVEWDDIVPEEINSKWSTFYSQLPLLHGFKVSRFIFASDSSVIQFHVFCDASEAGYGACMYARTVERDGHVNVQLIASKSRVAPLKKVSLPRLELDAARLGSRLYARVSAALRMEGTRCWFWSDSMVTLFWIRGSPNTWQTYVGNRTSEIQLLTHGHSWHHVKSSDNPADQVSRGLLPNEFLHSTIWQCGPTWLQKEENWPRNEVLDTPPDDMLERRKVVAVVQNVSNADSLYERYSTLGRLTRVTAFMLRFVDRCRSKNKNTVSSLSPFELNRAKVALAKGVQQDVFMQELKDLTSKKIVSLHSPLKLLRPFLDRDGIIRLEGRLQLSNERYRTKHPIVIPHNHPLSRLIARHVHIQNFHAGPRMTLSLIRQEYWPIRGRDLVNYVYRNCYTCFRQRPVPITQPQGRLPKARVIPNRPFAATGIDYCGPVYLKPTHRRAAARKAFIAVFICFATKAVHLELVCDLSTDAFIAALRRFIARRGVPVEIHSDNGTNFQGGKNKLVELYDIFNKQQNKEAVINECSSKGIIWHFIPPKAPNFGGLWEAAVKTTKSSLLKSQKC